jgi:hypothetical protein
MFVFSNILWHGVAQPVWCLTLCGETGRKYALIITGPNFNIWAHTALSRVICFPIISQLSICLFIFAALNGLTHCHHQERCTTQEEVIQLYYPCNIFMRFISVKSVSYYIVITRYCICIITFWHEIYFYYYFSSCNYLTHEIGPFI